MVLDRGKVMGGVMLYAGFVLAPTIGLLLTHYGWPSNALERVAVGILGIISGRMVWSGIRGGQTVPDPSKQTYWAFNPWLIALGLFIVYMAWFTNLPIALAGNFEGSVFVLSEGHVIPLTKFWPRVITTAVTAVGVFVLTKAVRSKKTPEERRQVRETKRLKKAMRQQANGQPQQG